MQSTHKLTKGLITITLLAVIVAWLVIGLGAYTRLTDAGLGCPDWPGCYGHVSVPNELSTIAVKQKAWTEMIHRYCAGTLAILVFLVAALCGMNAVRHGVSYLMAALALFLLVLYQALLGMLTVTLKLWPVVVSQHLLGGMCLLALLWMIFLKARLGGSNNKSELKIPWGDRFVALGGLIIVGLQIALGAWTSTNYAALVCPDFPFCQADWRQTFDFTNAFHLSTFGGVNYEGGVLNVLARQTIHMTHRMMAAGVVFYVIFMMGYFYSRRKQDLLLRNSMRALFLLLLAQVTLGILNVVWVLPLTIAVLHNLTAGLLLCAMVTVNVAVFRKTQRHWQSATIQKAMVYE